MTDDTDGLVADYLRRLDLAAAARLRPERRAELVTEISDHIAAARASGEAGDEAGLRNLLDRLGDPQEIADAAAEDEPWPPAGPHVPGLVTRPPAIGHEIAAILFLTLGSLVPIIGWLVGVFLAWTSRRWRTRDKLLATLVVPGGPGAVFLLGLVAGRTCSSSPIEDINGSVTTTAETCEGFALPAPLGIPLILAWVIAPIVVAVVLYSRAQRGAETEPPLPVVASPSRWGGLEIAAVVLLAVGSFLIPVVGPLVGLVLVWASSAWTATEKWVATLFACVAIVLPLSAFLAARAG